MRNFSFVLFALVIASCLAHVTLDENHDVEIAEDNAFGEYTHKCIHDQVKKELKPSIYSFQHLSEEYMNDRKRQLYAVAQPIRITFDTSKVDPVTDLNYGCQSTLSSYISPDGQGAVACQPEHVMGADKIAFVRNILIPFAKATFEAALKVVPLTNMSLSRSVCGTGNFTPSAVPTAYRNPSAMSGVDLLVMVTARPVRSDQNSTLAFAADCERDATTNRPILGFINLNPSKLNANDYQSLNSSLGTIIHEITHILGFSSDFFYGQFVNPNNTAQRIPLAQVVMSETVPSTGVVLTKFIGANVVSWARTHYNCPTLNGVELEDQGGAGTAGSHWKRRILQSEYMIGISPKFPVFSNFTLAYLDDTGFYLTNRSMAKTLQYGLNYGCDFVKAGNTIGSGCDAWPSDIYRCRGSGTYSCTFDRLAKSTCRLWDTSTDGPSPPAIYRYGSDQASSTDRFSDYCPRWSDYTTGTQNSFCTFSENKPNIAVDRGETYTDSARCFMSTLASGVASGTTDASPGCYQVVCASPSKMKILINSVYYPCTAGGTVTVEDFGGSLTCPSNNNLCANSPTIATWPEFVSVDPTQGTPGTSITIKGTNFVTGMAVTVGGRDVDNLVFVDAQTYTCDVSSTVDIKNLAAKTVHVILTNAQGQTAVGMDVFELQVSPDTVLQQIGNWISDNPIATAGICLGLVLIIGLGIFLCYRERQKARFGHKHGGDNHGDEELEDGERPSKKPIDE